MVSTFIWACLKIYLLLCRHCPQGPNTIWVLLKGCAKPIWHWPNGLQQPAGAFPSGPLTILGNFQLVALMCNSSVIYEVT
jgi:hypothetical protein